MKDTIEILGVRFSTANLKQTVEIIEKRIEGSEKGVLHLVTGNPEIVLQAQKDGLLKRIVDDAGVVTPDGIGIVMAARWKRHPLQERVTGVDLLSAALEVGNKKGWSFYFLGAEESVSKKAIEVLEKTHPGVVISGRHHGYFKPEEDENILSEIESLKPDILVVALGAPRAEKWIYKYKDRLPVKVAFGVGGSLDVIAGKVKRAPAIWIRLNLEWLHRLLSEPSRWRRQLVLPVFAAKAFKEAWIERGLNKDRS